MTDLYPDAAKAAVMTALNVPEAAVDTMNGRRSVQKFDTISRPWIR